MSRRSQLLFRDLPRALWRASAWRDLHVIEDLDYAAPSACRLDVLRPRSASGPLPVVLHVHGGAFRVLSKETHGYVAARYARAGFVVANVDYRLAPPHPYPAAVRDVHAAFAWVVEHIGEHGGDPTRILLSGESAGANLCLGLALSCALDRPEPWAQAVRSTGTRPLGAHLVYGFLQATDTARYGRDIDVNPLVARRMPIIEGDYLSHADHSAGLDYADPLRMVESLTPTQVQTLPQLLTVCGTKDPILDDTQRLVRAMERAGVATEAVWIEGAGHGFHVLPGRRSERAWQALLDHGMSLV